jgi:hypothetical protein
MSSALTVLKEQIKHFYLVRRLSVYEVMPAAELPGSLGKSSIR